MRKRLKQSFGLFAGLIFGAALSLPVSAHMYPRLTDQDETDGSLPARRSESALLARQLTNRDPLVRQGAAEELARLAAVDQRKLVEGYRFQEKNARVRLALDWALYRMGKSETLFAIVRALDSSLVNQAQKYLASLESPQPLYVFLERVGARGQIRLLEVLARSGDAETLERIKPYAESLDPKVADAARFAEREINSRLAHTPVADEAARPRRVGQPSEEDEP